MARHSDCPYVYVIRVGEFITLLGEHRGRYYITGIDHVLDEKRIETVQHVCVYVTDAPERI